MSRRTAGPTGGDGGHPSGTATQLALLPIRPLLSAAGVRSADYTSRTERTEHAPGGTVRRRPRKRRVIAPRPIRRTHASLAECRTCSLVSQLVEINFEVLSAPSISSTNGAANSKVGCVTFARESVRRHDGEGKIMNFAESLFDYGKRSQSVGGSGGALVIATAPTDKLAGARTISH